MAQIRQSRPDSGLGFQVKFLDRLRVGWGKETRQIDVEGAPTQSRVSPSIQRILTLNLFSCSLFAWKRTDLRGEEERLGRGPGTPRLHHPVFGVPLASFTLTLTLILTLSHTLTLTLTLTLTHTHTHTQVDAVVGGQPRPACITLYAHHGEPRTGVPRP